MAHIEGNVTPYKGKKNHNQIITNPHMRDVLHIKSILDESENVYLPHQDLPKFEQIQRHLLPSWLRVG